MKAGPSRVSVPLAFLLIAAPLQGQTLAVSNAGSLAKPFRELLDSFAAAHPGVAPAQENGGSLELARRIHDLGRVPDVYATADVDVILRVLIPGGDASWYVPFARNAMVLAYAPGSAGAAGITARNWWQVVTRPEVRMGASDPAVDPNGYRTLLVYQLAERYYRMPGLAARLRAATPPRFQRPNETDLLALVQSGELDYAWSYRSIAVTAGLKYLELPPEIDLSDAARAPAYAAATVRVRGRSVADSLELAGTPILYGATVPVHAPDPALGAAFVRFLFSPVARAILVRNGLIPVDSPGVTGTVPAGLRIR
jgi:molybdate/tungstate transport system substrate-binding protein